MFKTRMPKIILSFAISFAMLLGIGFPGSFSIAGAPGLTYEVYKDGAPELIYASDILQEAVDACVEDNVGYTIIATQDDTLLGDSAVNIPEDKIITLKSQAAGSIKTITSTDIARHFDLFGSLTLENIILEGDTVSAVNNGGITIYYGKLTMKNGSKIQHCRDVFGGGVCNVSGTINMDGNAQISENEAKNGGGVYNGPGINNVPGTLNMKGNAKISGNIATNGGGVGNSYLGMINMEANAKISGNEAINGGGVYNSSNMNNTGQIMMKGNASITENQAYEGGGVWNDGLLNLEGSAKINKNEATYGGGVYNQAYHVVYLFGAASISENEATSIGGGVYNDGSIYLDGNSTISANFAGDLGGGVFNWGSLGGTFKASINDNEAINLGGGVYNAGDLWLWQSAKILQNKALCGGGVYNCDWFSMEDNALVSENYAGKFGGGVYNLGDLYMSEDTIISKNKTYVSDSAALGMDSDDVESGNELGWGGGVFNSGYLSMYDDPSISENEAIYGGGVYNYGYISISWGYGAISNNKVSRSGGGVYNSEFATLNMESNTMINGNEAKWGGGVFNKGMLTMKGSASSINNTASEDGGGIYTVDHKNVTASAGVKFTGNRASKAYLMTNTADITLHNQKIKTTSISLPKPPFQYAYNNYDINYTKGDLYTTPTPTPTATPTQSPTVTPTVTPTPASPFISEHSAYIKGYEDESFRPNNNMTRAEVAVMFTRIIRDKMPQDFKAKGTVFSDVKKSDWFANEVEFLAGLNPPIIKGYAEKGGGAYFDPSGNITRAEFVTIVSRFGQLATSDSISFSDVSKTHWAYNEIISAAAKSWIEGYNQAGGGKYFDPGKSITRAEVVTIINRILGRNFGGEDFKNLKKPNDVSKTHWAYEAILEAMNDHDFEMKDGKEVWKEMPPTSTPIPPTLTPAPPTLTPAPPTPTPTKIPTPIPT